jgi:predicted dehydrogenase
MTPKIRIGLAGLGRMGRIHAASLSGRCPSARLACVFDASEGAAAQVGEQFGVPVARSFDLARAAGESWRWGRTVLVEPQRIGAGVIYTVKQESR